MTRRRPDKCLSDWRPATFFAYQNLFLKFYKALYVANFYIIIFKLEPKSQFIMYFRCKEYTWYFWNKSWFWWRAVEKKMTLNETKKKGGFSNFAGYIHSIFEFFVCNIPFFICFIWFKGYTCFGVHVMSFGSKARSQ